jgi:hypothetical protein
MYHSHSFLKSIRSVSIKTLVILHDIEQLNVQYCNVYIYISNVKNYSFKDESPP